MKLIELVDARGSLQKLVHQDLPLRTAYELMKLTDECNRHLGFYGAECAKFDPKKDPERQRELDNMEIDVGQTEKVRISMNGDLRLSAGDVKMLMPIIDFIEEG